MAVLSGYPCSVTAASRSRSSGLRADSSSTDESRTAAWELSGREGAGGHHELWAWKKQQQYLMVTAPLRDEGRKHNTEKIHNHKHTIVDARLDSETFASMFGMGAFIESEVRPHFILFCKATLYYVHVFLSCVGTSTDWISMSKKAELHLCCIKAAD